MSRKCDHTAPCPRCLSTGPCMLGCGMGDWDAPLYENTSRIRDRARRFDPTTSYSTRVTPVTFAR